MSLALALADAFRAQEERILQIVAQMLNDRDAPTIHQGTIMPGSFDPSDGTVEVLIGDTYSLIGDDGDTPATLKKVPLLSTMVGDLTAPIGGERVIIHRDFGAMLHHGDDGSATAFGADSPGLAQHGSPGIAPGERIIAHRNPTSLSFDAFRHLTNDGSTPGDGLAGVRDFSGGYHQMMTKGGHQITADDTVKILEAISAGGHQFKLDDAAKVASLKSAGGLLHKLDDTVQHITHQAGQAYTLLDGAGNVISHVAPSGLGLGKLYSSLSAANAAMHNGHITEFSGNIMSQMMQSFAGVYAAAMQTAGIPNAAAFYAVVKVAGWILNNVTPPTIPSGSSIVKIAS